jgi:hypothetical protein
VSRRTAFSASRTVKEASCSAWAAQNATTSSGDALDRSRNAQPMPLQMKYSRANGAADGLLPMDGNSVS